MGITDIVGNLFGQAKEKAEEKAEELEDDDKSIINQSGLFEDLEELPGQQKKIFEELFFPDEEFKMCVTLKGTLNAPHLALTDQRLIKATNTATGYNSESYDLDSISQFDYDDGLTKSTMSISGSGIDEEFTVSSLTTQDLNEFQQGVYNYK